MKKKVLFILPTLTAGGAERVISFIAQNIDSAKFESTLLVTGFKKDSAYKIEGINIIFLEKKRVLNAVPLLFWYLLRHKPNAVLSSIGHLNTVMGLMAPCFGKTKFIIREASVVSVMGSLTAPASHKFSFRGKMAHQSYKWVDKIVCQSKDMAEDFINIYKVDINKVVIINNPITKIPSTPTHIKTVEPRDLVKFITIGRLSIEKGHKRVIKLLSKLKFNFHYTIIGVGDYKDEIFKTIDEFNLTDKITYIPFTTEVFKYISENDFFLQGSYVEGFPNTVLESCLVGTPVLAFNVPGGTKEIISNNENGFLAETEDEYFRFLNEPLNWDREKIKESVLKKFDREKIIKEYEFLLD